MIVGPLQFDAPAWLLLAPALCALAWWIARQSLTGLSTATRRIALAIRFLVIALVCAALAEPRWRMESEDVATIVIADASRSMPPRVTESLATYVERAAEGARAGDRLGVITAAEEALVQSLPSQRNRTLDIRYTGAQAGTDLASALRLALAIKPADAATRIALMTDGNETAGSLLSAAQSAKAAGVPVDVYAIGYRFEREVIFDRLIAPPTARRGQTANLRFVLTATAPTRGRITLLANDQPIDLDPDTDGVSAVIDLARGVNVETLPITLSAAGPQRYRAVFEPLVASDDTIPENNAAMAVTFVGSEGRALVYAEEAAAADALVRALADSGLDADVRHPSEGPQSLVELGAYDAVALVDTSAYLFSRKQQEELRAYVHDLGGGLVVVGGPNSFGAGGWIGSPLADALPVKLDPPQKKHMPKGALALVMHSCEIPNGNYWGQQTAIAAVDAISSRDLVGVVEYDFRSGVRWVYPMAEAGDKSVVKQAINSLTFGDMPSFDASLQAAVTSLSAAAAGQKHCIVISDGDPAGPAPSIVQQFVNAKITVSTVAVFPHSWGNTSADLQKMRWIAQTTGGQHYEILQQSQLATLPQIFTKEAQTVKRSLIWEGDPFQPAHTGVVSEPLRGLGRDVPPVSGYIVTAEREGLALVTLQGPENDPILAQWQYGLGRVVALTTDGAARWSPAWLEWGQYRAFWEQHTRWAMRPTGSANLNVLTETKGDETLIAVEALDARGEPLNFATFMGRAVRPDLAPEPIELRQTAPGRYEGRLRTKDAGAYVLNLRYEAVSPGPDGAPLVDRGAVQAAITRPFADEHRALADNTPLLLQVAELTGGRVLDADPSRADLFSRDGIATPVATRAIWLAVAMGAIGLFLVDVGVRRVRVDLRAIGRAARRALSKQRRSGEQHVGALRAAKEKTQELLAERGAGTAATSAHSRAATSTVKFEATEESLRKPAPSPVVQPGPPSALGESAAPGASEKSKAAPPPEEEQGMARLMKAKKRARDSMGDEGQTKP